MIKSFPDARLTLPFWVASFVNGVLALALIAVLTNLTRYALIAPPSFDGALNLNIAASFVKGDGYGFVYDSFFAFAAQTDGPFILPSAIAFWLGGINPFTTQIVNLVYVGALAFLLIVLFRRLAAPWWLALVGALFCTATPGFEDFAMNGFGEIPMLVWFIAGLVAISYALKDPREHSVLFLLSGIFFGLCYLTKVVSLICIFPTVLIIILFIFRKNRAVENIFLILLGFFLMVMIWEIFRFAQFGNREAYFQWWRLQFGQIMSQSGASATKFDFQDFLEKGQLHFTILSTVTKTPPALLAAFIILPPFIFQIFALKHELPLIQRLLIGVMTVIGVLYFTWWVFITPTSMAWLRRIIDGLILQQCAIVGIVASVLHSREIAKESNAAPIKDGLKILTAIGIAPAILALAFMAVQGELIVRAPKRPSFASDLMRTADAMRALPLDAKVFGVGWWQAPVLALFSQRNIMNYDQWMPAAIDALPSKYFVTDREAQAVAQPAIEAVLASTQYRPIVQSQGGSLYELLKVNPYPPFGPADAIVSDLATGFDFEDGDYTHTRGIYARDPTLAWARPQSAAILKRSDQEQLVIKAVFPQQFFEQDQPSVAPVLHVSSPDCLDETLIITKAGPMTIKIPLRCSAWPDPRPFPVILDFNRHIHTIHQLDADNRLLGFLIQSIQLTQSANE